MQANEASAAVDGTMATVPKERVERGRGEREALSSGAALPRKCLISSLPPLGPSPLLPTTHLQPRAPVTLARILTRSLVSLLSRRAPVSSTSFAAAVPHLTHPTNLASLGPLQPPAAAMSTSRAPKLRYIKPDDVAQLIRAGPSRRPEYLVIGASSSSLMLALFSWDGAPLLTLQSTDVRSSDFVGGNLPGALNITTREFRDTGATWVAACRLALRPTSNPFD